jgi:hypothetical protein
MPWLVDWGVQITDVSASAILQFFKALEFNEFFDFPKRITPAGGGGPAGVIYGDRQPGGGVLPV